MADDVGFLAGRGNGSGSEDRDPAVSREGTAMCARQSRAADDPAVPVSIRESDLATFVQRYRRRLVENGGFDGERIESWLADLSDEGEWSDVDYDDDSRADWEPDRALDRIVGLATAYRSDDHPLSGDDRLREAAVSALAYWLDRDPRSQNWWWNEIGAPGAMRKILVLTEPWLEDPQKRAGLGVLGRAELGGTGANRIWNAKRVFMHGCLGSDVAEATRAVEDVVSAIQLRTDEGIQADYSFHQHGARLQQYHYGGAFVTSTITFANLVRGTGAIPTDRLRLLADLVLEGHRWMQRGGHVSPATQDRAFSRKGSLNAGYDTVFGMLADALSERASSVGRSSADTSPEAATKRVTALRRLADYVASGVPASDPPVTGHRHYPASDFTAHHRAGFSMTVKYRSDRTEAPEKTNDENLRGDYLNQGVYWLTQRGDEYAGWQPALDWTKLPGLTARQELLGLGSHGTEQFVGGLSAGGNGLCVHRFSGAPGRLSAAKAWFFADDRIACLGSGIEASQGDATVATTIDQRPLQCDVVVGAQSDGGLTSVAAGEQLTERVAWLHHDGIGISLPNRPTVTVDTREQSGAWGEIRAADSVDDTVSRDVFASWIDHGDTPDGASYAYVLAPGVAVDSMTAGTSATVVANTPQRQAVAFPSRGLVQGAFRTPGVLDTPAGPLDVDTACLVQVSDGEDGTTVTVTDPTGEAETVVVTHDGEEYEVALADCPLGRRAGSSESFA